MDSISFSREDIILRIINLTFSCRRMDSLEEVYQKLRDICYIENSTSS